MKLFSSTQISWSEPWFFLLRIREAWGWRRRFLLALGISAVMFLALHFFPPVQRGVASTIAISLAAGFVLVALFDVSNIQRDVTIKEDCIIVGSSIGRGWFKTFKFPSITGVQLLRRGEWPHPFAAMVIGTSDDQFLVAVPGKVSLQTIADILHRLGVKVTLSDWQPSKSDTRIGIKDEVNINPAGVHGEIAIQPVSDGPLMAPSHLAIQLVIALTPLMLALVGAIWTGIVVYRGWDAMSWLAKGLYGGVALAGLVLAFLYLIMIGQFLAAGYGIRVGRQRMQARKGAYFSGTEFDLVCVELFDRKSWTATISKSTDYGFLRIERPEKRLRFEGSKFRWTVPFSALTTCRIEESLVGSEANPTEKRYFVVIAANHEIQPWEAGMIYVRTEIGNDNAEARHQRAKLLFTQLAEAI